MKNNKLAWAKNQVKKRKVSYNYYAFDKDGDGANIVRIRLNQNKEAIIDGHNWDRVKRYVWIAHQRHTDVFVPVTSARKHMVEMITNTPHYKVSYLNNNKLDLREENLDFTETKNGWTKNWAKPRSNSYNWYKFDLDENNNQIVKIKIGRKYTTIIDLTDWDIVKQRKWCLKPCLYTCYANTHMTNALKKDFSVTLHRLLMNKTGKEIDHINGNGLDNRRKNIRFVTHGQNQQNSRKFKTYGDKPTSSKYKGVSLRKDRSTKGVWVSSLRHEGKIYYLGFFPYSKEKEAAIAYDNKARELFGEYARCNFSGRGM